MQYSSLAILLMLPIWIFAIQAGLNRVERFKEVSNQKLNVLSALVSITFVGIIVMVIEGDTFLASFTPLMFFTSVSLLLAHVSFHIFNMGETARRIFILISIKLGRSLDENKEEYKPEELITRRLARLEEWNQLEKREGKLIPKPTILLFATTVVKLQEKLLFPERF